MVQPQRMSEALSVASIYPIIERRSVGPSASIRADLKVERWLDRRTKSDVNIETNATGLDKTDRRQSNNFNPGGYYHATLANPQHRTASNRIRRFLVLAASVRADRMGHTLRRQ